MNLFNSLLILTMITNKQKTGNKKIIKKYILIFMMMVASIYLVRIMLWHNDMKRIEWIVIYAVIIIVGTYSLITTKIKKDKDKIKKL